MLSEDYIFGLTDGEGSFTVYIRPPKKEHFAKNWRIECHYYVKMREDELPLLREVKKFFKCGRISFQRDKRVNHKDCYRFEISDLENIEKVVIPLFKKNKNSLHSANRKKDFKIFYEIISLVVKKKHQTKQGLEKILKLRAQMH